jgi:hypothetical protein
MKWEIMKKLLTFIVIAVSFSAPAAVDYNCSIIGKNIDKASKKSDYLIFDGNEKTYLTWNEKQGKSVKGFTVNFFRLQKVNKITVLTDKNVQNLTASVDRWQAERFRYIPFDKNAKWKISEHNGKALFTFECAETDTFAVRITDKSEKFRIYECAVYGAGNTLLTAMAANGAKSAVNIVPDPKTDMVSGNLRMTMWRVGGIGKKKKAFFVGRANKTPRNDRVLVRMDCTDFIEKGRVEKAVFCFNANPLGNAKNSKIFMLEYLPVNNSELIKNDLSQSKTVIAAQFIVEDFKGPAEFRIDITEIVNNALAQGHGVLKFRFRDLEAENSRNIEKKVSAITLSKVKLDIVR